MGVMGSMVSGMGSMMGGMQQASSIEASGQAQANAHMYNAQVAENNAILAMQTGYANAKQQHRQNSARHGQLMVEMLGSGLDISTGSSTIVLAEDIAQGMLEEKKIIHDGTVKAYNYRNQATLDRYYADSAIAAADNQAAGVRTSGILGGVKSMFSVFGSK